MENADNSIKNYKRDIFEEESLDYKKWYQRGIHTKKQLQYGSQQDKPLDNSVAETK